jgi:hypothetical protein
MSPLSNGSKVQEINSNFFKLRDGFYNDLKVQKCFIYLDKY